MKSFLIIGMGSFGHHLCRSLSKLKCEIMVVDREESAVEDVLPLVVSAKIGDCTNPEVLRSFSVKSFDTCFVCMGTNFQNSLQITSLLQEMGANRVLSKADEDIHAKFLLRNGADAIIYPEKDIAERIAMRKVQTIFLTAWNWEMDISSWKSIPERNGWAKRYGRWISAAVTG